MTDLATAHPLLVLTDEQLKHHTAGLKALVKRYGLKIKPADVRLHFEPLLQHLLVIGHTFSTAVEELNTNTGLNQTRSGLIGVASRWGMVTPPKHHAGSARYAPRNPKPQEPKAPKPQREKPVREAKPPVVAEATEEELPEVIWTEPQGILMWQKEDNQCSEILSNGLCCGLTVVRLKTLCEHHLSGARPKAGSRPPKSHHMGGWQTSIR